jgi:acyl carrier protein
MDRNMNVTEEVVQVLDERLSLRGRARAFTRQTHLLGSVPELDSMAVVSLVTGLEERFGIAVDDADIDAELFRTVGSLCDFVTRKLSGQAAG